MAKLLTYLPSALLDQDVSGPYTVQLRRNARFEGDPILYKVIVVRVYTYVVDETHGSWGTAMAAYKEAKRIALINCGCMAFNVEPVDFDAVPA